MSINTIVISQESPSNRRPNEGSTKVAIVTLLSNSFLLQASLSSNFSGFVIIILISATQYKEPHPYSDHTHYPAHRNTALYSLHPRYLTTNCHSQRRPSHSRALPPSPSSFLELWYDGTAQLFFSPTHR